MIDGEVRAEEYRSRVLFLYFLSVLVFGFGIVAAIVFAGASEMPLLATTILGAVALTFFQIAKRLWSAHLQQGANDEGTKFYEGLFDLIVDNLDDLLFVFAIQVFVAVSWYYIGVGAAWLFQAIF